MIRFTITLVLFISSLLFPQLNLIWNSSQLNYNTLSGWLDFEKAGDTWKKRIYQLDSVSFRIMSDRFSLTPQYTYLLNANEIFAGLQIYSIGGDLDGNRFMDFYILSYSGTYPYRQSAKIFDITANHTILERNDAFFYFSYPYLEDVNNDGLKECIILKFDYPLFTGYSYEVYSTSSTGIEESSLPNDFRLFQNFPNPFNPSTTIRFNLPEASPVQVKIFDIKGELIKIIPSDEKPAGENEMIWDGTNNKGTKQPSGVYLCQLNSNSNTDVRKMILLK